MSEDDASSDVRNCERESQHSYQSDENKYATASSSSPCNYFNDSPSDSCTVEGDYKVKIKHELLYIVKMYKTRSVENLTSIDVRCVWYNPFSTTLCNPSLQRF